MCLIKALIRRAQTHAFSLSCLDLCVGECIMTFYSVGAQEEGHHAASQHWELASAPHISSLLSCICRFWRAPEHAGWHLSRSLSRSLLYVHFIMWNRDEAQCLYTAEWQKPLVTRINSRMYDGVLVMAKGILRSSKAAPLVHTVHNSPLELPRCLTLLLLRAHSRSPFICTLLKHSSERWYLVAPLSFKQSSSLQGLASAQRKYRVSWVVETAGGCWGGLGLEGGGGCWAPWLMHGNEICITVFYGGDCVLRLSRLLEVIILCKNTKCGCHWELQLIL